MKRKPESDKSTASAPLKRAHFTMIPNLIDDTKMSVYAFRLYAHLRRVAGEDGYCKETTRELADECFISEGKVSDAKHELVALKLITVELDGRQNVCRVVDIWAANAERYGATDPTNDSDDDRSRGERIVHAVNDSITNDYARAKEPHEEPLSGKNTHTDARAREARPSLKLVSSESASPVCVCSSFGLPTEHKCAQRRGHPSCFSFDERERYANRHNLHTAWLNVSRRGESDEVIARDLARLRLTAAGVVEPVAPPDVSACPDCEGRGLFYPAGFAKGAAKCRHPRLDAAAVRGSPARAG